MPKAIDARSTGAPSMSSAERATPPALPSPHRRGLLASAAAALAAAPFTASYADQLRSVAAQLRTVGTQARDADADAGLLADIAELLAMSRYHDALCDEEADMLASHPRAREIAAIYAADFGRFHELRARIATTPATTPGAAKAKAALAIERFKWSYSGMPSDDWDADEALAYSALLDLMGRAAA